MPTNLQLSGIAPVTNSLQQVRHAGQIAEWMHDRGQMVMEFDPEQDFLLSNNRAYATPHLLNRGLSLEDIQPGDLVFFAEKAMGQYIVPDAYKHISHVAIVTSSDSYFTKIDNVKTALYKHEIIEVVSPIYAYYCGGSIYYGDNYVQIKNPECNIMQKRRLWTNPIDGVGQGQSADLSAAWGGTMVMVCRPNLMQAGIDESLAAEAARMGLHTVPDNWGVMNTIKRARQFTDIKWKPAVDLKRYTVKYWQEGNGNIPVYYDNARFEAGVEYQGMPAVALPSGDDVVYEGTVEFNFDSELGCYSGHIQGGIGVDNLHIYDVEMTMDGSSVPLNDIQFAPGYVDGEKTIKYYWILELLGDVFRAEWYEENGEEYTDMFLPFPQDTGPHIITFKVIKKGEAETPLVFSGMENFGQPTLSGYGGWMSLRETPPWLSDLVDNAHYYRVEIDGAEYNDVSFSYDDGNKVGTDGIVIYHGVRNNVDYGIAEPTESEPLAMWLEKDSGDSFNFIWLYGTYSEDEELLVNIYQTGTYYGTIFSETLEFTWDESYYRANTPEGINVDDKHYYTIHGEITAAQQSFSFSDVVFTPGEGNVLYTYGSETPTQESPIYLKVYKDGSGNKYTEGRFYAPGGSGSLDILIEISLDGDIPQPEVPEIRIPGIDTSIDTFAYSVGIEGTENTTYDPDGDELMEPATGWRFPSDLIRYAFGEVDDDFWNHNELPFGSGEDSLPSTRINAAQGSLRAAAPTYNIPTGVDIKLGDVFDRRAIVTDLIKEDGAITHVEVCYATREGCFNASDVNGPFGGLAIREMMSMYRFQSLFMSMNQEAASFS